eukprot:GEZU01023229.1.p1 GENE.GEZU01023229.1~~GEZU01023229.1.p1  ORF type:complete len:673 (+),score=118.71 GEZU01023229.1:209-2020(+)
MESAKLSGMIVDFDDSIPQNNNEETNEENEAVFAGMEAKFSRINALKAQSRREPSSPLLQLDSPREEVTPAEFESLSLNSDVSNSNDNGTIASSSGMVIFDVNTLQIPADVVQYYPSEETLREMYLAPDKYIHFEEPDTEDNIIFTYDKVKNKREIKGATLDKLIQRLTHHQEYDNDFLYAFLLTYRSFTNPKELIEKLRCRYNTPPAPEILYSPAAFTRWRTDFLNPMRLRVCQVLKYWVENHFFDFRDEEEMTKSFMNFVSEIASTKNISNAGERLKATFEKQFSKNNAFQLESCTFTSERPKPRLPKAQKFMVSIGKMNSIPLIHWPATEIARQLTLQCYELYTRIQPKECLNQNWNKAQRAEKAKNIFAMITRTNLIGAWVADEIVSCENIKDRVHAIKKFIKIAKICRSLGNYNEVFSIMGGLNSNPIHRLKKSWEAVPPKSIKDFKELEEVVDPNNSYKNVRAAIMSTNPPCIPYIGMYLTSLTFLEDGNKDNLPNGLINFSKRRLLSAIIRDIQMYQQTPYNLEVVAELKERLEKVEPREINVLYKISQEREPPEQRATSFRRSKSLSGGSTAAAPALTRSESLSSVTSTKSDTSV